MPEEKSPSNLYLIERREAKRRPVKQGATIAVKILGSHGNNLPDEAPRLYEIMWVAAKDHRPSVGARVLQGEKLANANFPLENGREKRYLQ